MMSRRTTRRSYIRIGGIVPRPVRAQGSRAARLTYSIEVHSRSEEGSGRVEATRIGEAVTAALNENEDALTSADLAVGGGQARRDPRGAYALGALTWQARSTR